MRFRDRLVRFFYGRNGIDSLYYGLFGLIIFLWILQAVFARSAIAVAVFRILETAALLWMVFRVLSRNLAARRRESEKFSKVFGSVKNFCVLQKNKIRDAKAYRYRKCVHCRAMLRLPKRKGTHSVICPRCNRRFDVSVRF